MPNSRKTSTDKILIRGACPVSHIRLFVREELQFFKSAGPPARGIRPGTSAGRGPPISRSTGHNSIKSYEPFLFGVSPMTFPKRKCLFIILSRFSLKSAHPSRERRGNQSNRGIDGNPIVSRDLWKPLGFAVFFGRPA